MPALVNSRGGSCGGTSGEDETTVWPRSAKNCRKPERTSDRLFMGPVVTALKWPVTPTLLPPPPPKIQAQVPKKQRAPPIHRRRPLPRSWICCETNPTVLLADGALGESRTAPIKKPA